MSKDPIQEELVGNIDCVRVFITCLSGSTNTLRNATRRDKRSKMADIEATHLIRATPSRSSQKQLVGFRTGQRCKLQPRATLSLSASPLGKALPHNLSRESIFKGQSLGTAQSQLYCRSFHTRQSVCPISCRDISDIKMLNCAARNGYEG